MREHKAKDRQPAPLFSRSRIVERWALRRLGTLGHERRVWAIASTLYELTRELGRPRHALSDADRKLLKFACLVHDVGRSVEDARHPRIGAEMLLRDSSLPISARDRRRLAYLTRYHRGAVPEVGYDDILRPGDSRKATRRLLALLRAADTLDNRNIPAPRLVISMKGRKVRVLCFIAEDCEKSRRVFARRKKFRLLEELLDCKIEVEIQFAEAVQSV
jgi:exopolyphosphatase/guanosine-5'-triphosphate,3'-diphosphate pyrophosphatase